MSGQAVDQRFRRSGHACPLLCDHTSQIYPGLTSPSSDASGIASSLRRAYWPPNETVEAHAANHVSSANLSAEQSASMLPETNSVYWARRSDGTDFDNWRYAMSPLSSATVRRRRVIGQVEGVRRWRAGSYRRNGDASRPRALPDKGGHDAWSDCVVLTPIFRLDASDKLLAIGALVRFDDKQELEASPVVGLL